MMRANVLASVLIFDPNPTDEDDRQRKFGDPILGRKMAFLEDDDADEVIAANAKRQGNLCDSLSAYCEHTAPKPPH